VKGKKGAPAKPAAKAAAPAKKAAAPAEDDEDDDDEDDDDDDVRVDPLHKSLLLLHRLLPLQLLWLRNFGRQITTGPGCGASFQLSHSFL